MRRRKPVKIVNSDVYKVGLLSHLAAFRCSACQNVLPVWVSLKTLRPRNSIDAIRCATCHNCLVPRLWFGAGVLNFVLIAVPLIFLAMAKIPSALSDVNWLSYVHPTRGSGEPNVINVMIAFVVAMAVIVPLNVIFLGRFSKTTVENDWSDQ